MQTRHASTIGQYEVPVSVEEAARAMSDGRATILAGGTDLMLQTRSGKRRIPGKLVNISRIHALRGIDIGDDVVRIGALTRITDILDSDRLRECVRVLVDTANHFASPQIRNAATVGGNLCNASPSADMAIPFLLLDAGIELVCWRNGALAARRLPLDLFFKAPGETARRPDELLTRVEFPLPQPGFFAGFCKSGRRPALEIATASVGIAGFLGKGALTQVRVAVG
ncbi:MAG TPA: FAD binding domain-containing protein, partial [Woeseiaceae bacterium]|nr:FAD binding domain-containing protein [Woeseiaceae bacterium]